MQVKAYTTRVGSGPFPTENLGKGGDLLRFAGQEFGTTTGRPRRCGWLDVVALKYCSQINGFSSLNLTKLDVLSEFDEIQLGVAYKRLDGTPIDSFPADLRVLEQLKASNFFFLNVVIWSCIFTSQVSTSNCLMIFDGGLKCFIIVPADLKHYTGWLNERAPHCCSFLLLMHLGYMIWFADFCDRFMNGKVF